MIQRIHMEGDVTGRGALEQPAAMSAARAACRDAGMFEAHLGQRIAGEGRPTTMATQVRNGYARNDKSTPIGARTGRAARGDPGG